MVDKTKLDKDALELFKQLVEVHPEWENLASNDQYVRAKTMFGGQLPPLEGFRIEIPCPFTGNPPLELTAYDPYVCDLNFGLPFKVFEEPTIDEICEYIDEIRTEELIAAEWRNREGSLWQCGLISVNEWKLREARVHLLRSVSWAGTYNLLFSGTWEWGSGKHRG
jgi:hypothetical protein